MTSNFIDLGRRFSIVEKDTEKDPDRIKNSFWASTPTVGWSDLLQEYRVVILSEPGAGKTEELKYTAQIKKDQGNFSFFIRLELVEDCNWEDCFEIGTSEEFKQWLVCSDSAWLFLDSVDEARLSNKISFEKALRHIFRKLGQSQYRTHIFISSRVKEWLATSDLELFDRIFPGPRQQNIQNTDEHIDQSINGQAERNSQEPTEPLVAKVYQLQPLNKEQIRHFSEFKGVNNTTLFLDEIERSNSEIFANRPQDLLDLIVFWQKHERLGKHEEMLYENIRRKLKEIHPGHDEHGPLSLQRAENGIQILAAAATLQKKSAFLVPDKIVPTDRQTIAIEAKEVLVNWNSTEINTLLGRAVFDPAIYGTVRFHHRSVREYLTAKYLQSLFEQGNKSRREVERLLFANQYGETVVISSMRPVAAWLALWDSQTRLRLREIAPDVLLQYGDPSSLEMEFRKTLLRRFMEQYGDNKYLGSSFDINVLKRLADPELASTVSQLFLEYAHHEESCILLLKLVWYGKIDGIVTPVKEIVVNPAYSSEVRTYAIWALSITGEKEACRDIVESLLLEQMSLDIKLIGAILENFYPNNLSAEEFIQLIARILNPKRNGDFFSLDQILKVAFQNELSQDRQHQLLDGMIRLIEQKPWIQSYRCKFSQNYSWLITHTVELAINSIRNNKNRPLTPTILSLIINFCISHHSVSDDGQCIGNLKELVISLPEIGYQLFWQAIEHCRKSEIPSENLWTQARYWLKDIWVPTESHLEKFIQDICDRPLVSDRIIALSVVFLIYKSLQCPSTLRERLILLVQETEEIKEQLNKFLDPTLSEDQRTLNHQMQQQQNRIKKKAQKEQLRQQKWLTELAKVEWLENLRHVPGAEDGTIYNSTLYLYRELQDKSRVNESSRWGYANWSSLKETFGETIATAFRDGCRKYWREYNPYSYPNWRNSNSVPHSRIIGLTGLAIEAKDNPNWARQISLDECKAAARYLPFELNGFPDWYQALFEVSPEEFDRIIYEELRWELHETPAEQVNSRILSKLSYGDSQLKKRYQEFILKLLEEKDMKNPSILQSSLSLILTELKNEHIQRLQKLAIKYCKESDILELQQIWLRTLLCINPMAGVTYLKSVLSKFRNREKRESWMLQFCAKLGRDDFLEGRVNLDSNNRASFLKEFLTLVYRDINPEYDVRHDDGMVYSPDDRDEAQTTRYWLTELLVQTPGKVSYDTLKSLSICTNHSFTKDYLASKARERAELDVEESWSSRKVADLSQAPNWQPTSPKDLFELALARLDDLKSNLEEGDDSIAKILKEVKLETDIRNWLARDLRLISRNHYQISQEEEFADAKRTDIRFIHSHFLAVPVELKIAENWSYSELKERLENQLIKQYMRVSPYGIFLLVYSGGKSYWKSPKRLYFKDLIVQLKQDADTLLSNYPNIKEIQVIGLDCTLRHQSPDS